MSDKGYKSVVADEGKQGVGCRWRRGGVPFYLLTCDNKSLSHILLAIVPSLSYSPTILVLLLLSQ